jgi:hypothetical protein
MKTTEKLQDRQSTILPISLSTLGKKLLRKEKTYAKVTIHTPFLTSIIGLLDKNRHKRPTLEETLNHPWFQEFKDIHEMRQGAKEGEARFMAYTLTEPNSPKIKEEIEKYKH